MAKKKKIITRLFAKAVIGKRRIKSKMPIGRILLKSISESKKLSILKTDGARLLYTWLIPHLDINGCHSGDSMVIRGKIFTRLIKSIKTIEGYLQELENVGLIIRYEVNGDIFLNYPDFVEKQPKLNPEREGKVTITPPTHDQLMIKSGVNQDNLPHKLNEVKLNKVNVREEDLAPTERKILNELKKVKNYPYNFTDTIEYIRELAVGFPGVDILDEIQKKVAWWLDNPLTKKSNPHLQLRNWFKNAVKFNNERRQGDRVGGQGTKDKATVLYEKQKAEGMFDDLDGED